MKFTIARGLEYGLTCDLTFASSVLAGSWLLDHDLVCGFRVLVLEDVGDEPGVDVVYNRR